VQRKYAVNVEGTGSCFAVSACLTYESSNNIIIGESPIELIRIQHEIENPILRAGILSTEESITLANNGFS
jgi:hypothetical protein